MAPSYERGGIHTEDFLFVMDLIREGFTAIPDTLQYRGIQLIVVVEGRKPHC